MFDAITQALMQPAVGLAGVALAAFLAATVLPLSSELVLLAWVALNPQGQAVAWWAATLGNTAGGMLTYAMGRGARHVLHADALRAMERLRRHGAVLTALGWLPGVGDALVLAAGYLRMNAAACLAWQLLGRGARYAVLLGAFQGLLQGWLRAIH